MDHPERPLLIAKPSIVNALLPVFLQRALVAMKWLVLPLLVVGILAGFHLVKLTLWQTFFIFLFLVVIVSLASMTIEVITLFFTHFYFYNTFMTKEYRFFNIKKETVPYAKIANINVVENVWDRLCRAGTIVIRTVEEDVPDLELKYIVHPEDMERRIYHLIKSGDVDGDRGASLGPQHSLR